VTSYVSILSPKGNIATYIDLIKSTHDILALDSISTIKSRTWIIDSRASQHVTGAVRELSSYTCLAVLKNIQTTDWTT
jgi:hypothetical protein